MRPPKIGEFVPVKEHGRYSGQQIRWTEKLLRVEETLEEILLFHSSDVPLCEFRAKETCFYEGYFVAGYVYSLSVPPGTEVARYRGGEVRVELEPGMKLRYLGRMIVKYEDIRPGWCRKIARYTGLLKQYAHLA